MLEQNSREVFSIIEQTTSKHMECIKPAFGEKRTKNLPYAFFADASLLEDDPLRIIKPDLYRWHLDTCQINLYYLKDKRKPIIRRIVPIIKKNRSRDEIDLIKYSLHFQLTAGTELWVVFTNNKNFFSDNEIQENISVIKGHSVVDSGPLYHGNLVPINTDYSKLRIKCLYDAFEALKSQDEIIRIWYSSYAFRSFRNNKAINKYYKLLYILQNGLCSSCNISLDNSSPCLDHIWPLESGGNNSLINIQLLCSSCNLRKGSKILNPRHYPSAKFLYERNLSYSHYWDLGDRSRTLLLNQWKALARFHGTCLMSEI